MRSPGFTSVAVLTLALGIGANTAIFSAVNSVLFRPLPYEDPERLVLVWNRMTNNDRAPVSGPDFVDYQTETTLFEDFAATNRVFEQALTGDGPPEQIKVGGVTANFFDALRVQPALGRSFEAADANPIPPSALQPGGTLPNGALVLSHGFWQRRFGGDSGALGRTVHVNGLPMEIVGIMPPWFRLHMPTGSGVARQIDAWAPMRFDLSQAQRDFQTYRVLARLRPGVTLAAAQAEMDAVAARHRERHQFHRNMGVEIFIAPMLDDVVGHVKPTLFALLGAVAFVLLIACANVANLMLTRATARTRELAIRSALGAGRGRLIRQILTESVVLAILGGTAGLLLARLGIDALAALRPANLPRTEQINIDFTVLAFTGGATVLAAMLFGIAPAVLGSPKASAAALRDRAGTQPGASRFRRALVATEVALSLVLLIGAGLMFRSFVALQQTDPGFVAKDVSTFNVSLPFATYGVPEQRADFFQQLHQSVSKIPGVESVGAVFPLPLSGRLWTGPYGREGEPPETWSENEANFR
jgi:putative ABC transport system permease protein